MTEPETLREWVPIIRRGMFGGREFGDDALDSIVRNYLASKPRTPVHRGFDPNTPAIGWIVGIKREPDAVMALVEWSSQESRPQKELESVTATVLRNARARDTGVSIGSVLMCGNTMSVVDARKGGP